MNDTDKKPRQVKCPQCGHLALYAPENPYRPFCSERCRLIDLGEWASESYRVPVESSSSEAFGTDDEFSEPSEDDEY